MSNRPTLKDLIISHLIIREPPLSPEHITKSIDPPHSISYYDSMIHWDRWSNNFNNSYPYKLEGWSKRNGRYLKLHTDQEWLKHLCKSEESMWSGDMRQISALGASKSNLKDFETFGDMVQQNSKDLVGSISISMIEKNLSHYQIRIFNSDSGDYLVTNSWTNRISLINSGGSHHFAAAHYLATQLNYPIPLTCTMYKYTLDSQAILNLCTEFDVYVINNERNELNIFHDYMSKYSITYYYRELPLPLKNSYALFLPKKEILSNKVSNLLRATGHYYLNDYFLQLISENKI